MALFTLNQNSLDSQLNSLTTLLLNSKTNNKSNNSYYSKKGEPMYQEAMDSDRDGIVSFEEFKAYCKANNISSKDIADMTEMRMAYRMSQNADNIKQREQEKMQTGSLDLIYAKDGDNNYDAELDINRDSKISYNEYLRYCEQNARMDTKNSDTKIIKNSKNKFMTRSFGHASDIYRKIESELPEGKVENKA